MSDTLKNAGRLALVIVGLLQAVGHVVQWPTLRGLGAITVASPLPIVFTQQNGVETFASDFTLEAETSDGPLSLPITPAIYSRFEAPYNYRNVIGAAISYGPLLPAPMLQSVLGYCFQSPGPLSKALGLTPPLIKGAIVIKTRTAGRHDVWRLELPEQPDE